MKNYLGAVVGLSLLVTILLCGMSLIAPGQVFGFKIKQANILADIVSDSALRAMAGLPHIPPASDDMLALWVDDEYLESRMATDSLFRAELYDYPDSSRALYSEQADIPSYTTASFGETTPLNPREATETDNVADAPETGAVRYVYSRKTPVPSDITPIRDYSPTGNSLQPFFDKLDRASTLGRPIRIAVLGDSFIEGDIMTADLREMFQKTYGGGGVGFVPVTSQVADFRRSVVHKFGDWHTRSIVNNSAQGDYTISSLTFEPAEGTSVEWKGSKYKSYLGSFSNAKLVFINRGNTSIRVSVNGRTPVEFRPESSGALQHITLSDSISSIRFEFSSVGGFTAYGAFLEDADGVSLDNYSVRGNSGIPMGRISHDLCMQLDRIAPYDLIVLEYGLNATSADVTNYSGYLKEMVGVVEHLKQCFPRSAILILSVSDRSTRVAGNFVTMQGIKAMEHTQHELARRTGVAFWSTLDAMRRLGGMEKFVENGWAASDYTHLGARGGAKVAASLFESLMFEKSRWERIPPSGNDTNF